MSSVFVVGGPSKTTLLVHGPVTPVRPTAAEWATQTLWKFCSCVMLQPNVRFCTGSAVIHCTYTSPELGSTSSPLGTVLQNESAPAGTPLTVVGPGGTPIDAITEGPNVVPPLFEAAT